MIEDAFTQSDYAISITDPKGKLLRINDAYLRLYKFESADQVLGRTSRIISSPLTPDGVYKELWETIASGKVWRGEMINRAVDGSEVFVHLTISPIRRDEKIVGYMGFSLDRHQQVVLEKQLFHANKLMVLGTFGAGVAHELNNPLASIVLDAEFLKDRLKEFDPHVDVDSALRAADAIIEAGERMRRVLEHLLLYSKKDLTLANSTLSMSRLLKDSFIFVERQLRSRGIEIDIQVDKDAYLVANQAQLESVFHNLISNSRDAFEAKGKGGKRIAISTAFIEEKGLVRIDYRDNAGGIPAAVLKQIFDPFFTTKGGSGSGLGLSISRHILSQHGGHIHCESDGEETLFRIHLPAVAS